jgi:hypothetical protein
VATAKSIPNPTPLTGTQLQREYVVAGRFTYYNQQLRSLNWAIDDLARDLGDEIYDRMMRDPQVNASLAVYKASIIEDGCMLEAAVTDPEEDGYAVAQQLRDKAELMFEQLETPLDAVLWNMLDAAPYGSKVSELVWDIAGPSGEKEMSLLAIKPKPRRSTTYVVDPYMNLIGMLAVKRTSPFLYAMASNQPVVDIKQVIPREKFAVLTFRKTDGDPRGTSILRCAYDPWNRKRQVLPDYVKYLAQFAGPSLIGISGPDADSVPVTDEEGNPSGDESISAEQALATVLAGFKNSSAIALPNGTIVQPIQSTGEGRAFLNALQHCDAQIVVGILTQTLATMEAEHQARAAAQVHQDVLDTLIRQGKKDAQRMLYWDILRKWVFYNWGEALLTLTPKPTLGSAEQRMIPTLMAAIAQLVQCQFLQPDQYPGCDRILGLPKRDMAALQLSIDAANMANELAAQPPPPPEPPSPPAGTESDAQGQQSASGEAA